MEPSEKKKKKENNKYVLLEKPMIFNSKLNKAQSQHLSKNNKDITINNISNK